MIHKIIGGKTKQKQRNIKNSIIYLLREKKPEEQEFIKILSGSKDQLLNFNKTIINKNLKSPYVAGVLSFEEENTEETKKYKIISEFEEMIFAGIPEEYRPPVLWVEHRDKGRLELNYLTFNAINTGRSFPVFLDKTDRRLFNDFSEIINYQNGFTSPFDDFSDVQKKRMTEPAGNTLPKAKKELIALLNNRLCSLINSKKINNKNELIQYLKEVEGFKINRISKNTVSIITSIDETPIRLKGDIYQDGRDYNDYFQEKKLRPERSQAVIDEKLNQHQESYKKGLEARTARNKKVYIDPILNRLKQNLINKNQDITVGVTIPEERKNDNKKQFTPSPVTTAFNTIERIRKQQQEIDVKQQFIHREYEKSRSRIDNTRTEISITDGRFRFFGDYFDRFGQFFNETMRSIKEFLTIEKRPEEKQQPKPEAKKQEKSEVKGRFKYR
ncbi:hypothetical protein [Providencia stuartii]|uniref:hypothetical protein n=1 Tax=Providencia stuartii TaxID=588 RepID=UPI003001968C